MTNDPYLDKFLETLKEVLLEREAKEQSGQWKEPDGLPTLEDFLSNAKDMPFQDILEIEDTPTIKSVKLIDPNGQGFEFVGKFTYVFKEDFNEGTSLILKAVKEQISQLTHQKCASNDEQGFGDKEVVLNILLKSFDHGFNQFQVIGISHRVFIPQKLCFRHEVG